MYVLHCTRKLLDRLKVKVPTEAPEDSTTALGAWYATPLPWRPQSVLLVNATTLLPVVMPLAPVATLQTRFVGELALVLHAHRVPADLIDPEVQAMEACVVAKTASRSLLGMLNEFSFLADVFRNSGDDMSLLDLSLKLSTVPCGPLKGGSPDRTLRALVQGHLHAG